MVTDETHQKKHYRRPRRRPAHLRTKTGCLTCRNRKKKCDETPTVCNNCSRGSLLCTWPSESCRSPAGRTPIGNVPEQGVDIFRHDEDSSDQFGPSGCSDQIPNDNWSSALMTNNHIPTCIYTPSIIAPNPVIISAESASLLDFLRTVFLRSLIHPMAPEATIDFFIQEGLQTAFNTPCLMHALLACCGAEFPTDDPRYQRIAQVHYAKAIAGLRANLACDNLISHSIFLLRTVIVLCIYERSKPRLSRGVDIHLLGAAQLIHLYLSQNKNPMQSDTDSAMLRLMLEAFIFHTVTSIPFQQSVAQSAATDSAFALAERRLEESFSPKTCLYSTHSPVLGVPPKLFGYIREIALMHQKHPVNGVDLLRCYELEEVLGQWEEDIEMSNPLPLGPRLYILASKILLRSLIGLVSGTTTKIKTADTYLQSLVSDGILLITQLQPSTDYYAEYYCWPILVVGMSAIHQFERECLLSQVFAFWKATRNGTMRRLLDILTGYWSEKGKGV